MRNEECGMKAKPNDALRHSAFSIPNSELK